LDIILASKDSIKRDELHYTGFVVGAEICGVAVLRSLCVVIVTEACSVAIDYRAIQNIRLNCDV